VSRRHRHEEHQNHEAWAIPFADLLTLLLAFFVVMYSISSVNAGKYRVLSDSLTAAFRGAPDNPSPIDLATTSTGVAEQMPIQAMNRIFNAGLPASAHMPLPQARGTERAGDTQPTSADPRDREALLQAEALRASQRQLDTVASDLSGVLAAQIRGNVVQVQRRGDAVEVRISADVLFGSGQAEPMPAAVPILQHLAESLRAFPNAVRVEGHTDNVPVRTGSFRSNWELSGARAGAVVRLFSERGVDPLRLSVVGYGEYHPVQGNDTPAGRNANRRVAIMILGGASALPGAQQQ
jgi:chemotaxis protein MotB